MRYSKYQFLLFCSCTLKGLKTYLNNCNPYPNSYSRYSCTLEPMQVLMKVLRKGSTLRVKCFHSSSDAALLVSSFPHVIITIINLAMFIWQSIDLVTISHNKFVLSKILYITRCLDILFSLALHWITIHDGMKKEIDDWTMNIDNFAFKKH